MELNWSGVGIDKYPEIANEVIEILDKERISVLCLKGDLGAGKTTFSKTLFSRLGVVDEILSPTFSLVNEYHNDKGDSFFHFDFYRIKNIEEAYDIGYEDYFYSGRLCVIEWPEMIEGLLNLPKGVIFIDGDGVSRNLKLYI
jgi:tRNA threonylcarbamoyladenosine biosynthesis protein TsaE